MKIGKKRLLSEISSNSKLNNSLSNNTSTTMFTESTFSQDKTAINNLIIKNKFTMKEPLIEIPDFESMK
jgi:hypothetical protein